MLDKLFQRTLATATDLLIDEVKISPNVLFLQYQPKP